MIVQGHYTLGIILKFMDFFLFLQSAKYKDQSK